MAPCLAESWKESPDGIVYEFKLREGLRFHNGDAFTAEDVKWSFQRYRGVSARLLHERVKAVEVVDPYRVRFVLQAPWPDFLAFYGTPATGAGWIVPRAYIEKVGEEGFKRHPVGLGPYKFIRLTPGIELVLEANEQYWRKKPSIERVVIKGVPDRTTRLAMLKTREADIAYLMVGVGYPNGFDADDLTPVPPFTSFGEAVSNSLAAAGIRTRVRSMERATFFESWKAKKLRGIIMGASAGLGNAPARLEVLGPVTVT